VPPEIPECLNQVDRRSENPGIADRLSCKVARINGKNTPDSRRNCVKRHATLGVFGILSLSLSAAAIADDEVHFSPRVELVHVNYSGDFKASLGGQQTKNDLNISLFGVRLGGTVAKGRGYLDAYYQTSITKDSDTLYIFGTGEKFDADRSEWVVAGGYRIFDSVSAFGGVRSSDAGLDGKRGSKVDVDQFAYFLGASYARPVQEYGVFSANAAYVWINDVDYRLKEANLGFKDTASGDGNGWKLGASWTGELAERTNYSLGVDYYSYDWKVSGPFKTDAEEGELALRASISYLF
jgi:hypothetical protein